MAREKRAADREQRTGKWAKRKRKRENRKASGEQNPAKNAGQARDLRLYFRELRAEK